ncbi:mRNA cleavage and polyadenylation specificity factor-like protein [Salinilacihabitans rarus]|uniref:mRNA cleavage and polyadenylation specificity factor-like protein n=1 Tax=Salinilacihabitans rarus TaxID=2961596 RepID=UPI0020C90A00|nr:mRNA cleavage and polyadenylation specificity factor-like protein [Salinilacihabitans rarus]
MSERSGSGAGVGTVRRRDGIHFDVGRRVVADARRAVGDVNVVSHAHADHTLRSSPGTVVCSAATAAIAAARTGVAVEFVEEAPGIDLVPAGHVVGSRAALFEGEDGRRYCYTGDFSTRDRWYLDGFDPEAVAADVLVMETTYGRPEYRFPAQADLEGEIRDWLREHDDRPLFLFGYSLGRAQKLQYLASEATGRDVLVSDSIDRVNRAIEAATGGDLAFAGRPYEDGDLAELTDEVVILPSNQSRSEWVERLVDRTGGLKAGFSGWAVDDSYRYRGNYDATFPLTDHCDFDELLATVRAIDPDVVYTHHGFAEAFADVLETEHGYRARPLKRDQTTLEEFC